MTKGASRPENEKERLKRARGIYLTDHHDDVFFQKIALIAAEHYRAPIALISIVDKNHQWFKASIGLQESQTPREFSFCAYSTLNNEPLEVLDASLDPRFVDNALVNGAPYIRYYAGVPLTMDDGFTLGNLCIIDTVPRPPMKKREAEMLTSLAELAIMRIPSISKKNFVDQSTGLFNRLRMEEDIHQALATKEAKTIYAVDVISPRFLNDIIKALGYSFTEDLILSVKLRIQKLLPKNCLLYKIGNTRFGFCLTSNAPCELLCQHILKDFIAPVECHGIPIPMRLGIGVVPLSDADTTSSELLRIVVSAADEAREQNLGRSIFQPEVDAMQKRAFMLLSSLPEAILSPNQLSIVYQPKINLSSGTCDSVEALIRWEHPLLGPISPAEFIPLAEKTALIPSISYWVLKAIITQLKEWKNKCLFLRIAMNIAVVDLESPDFVDTIIYEFKAEHLDPRNLELEFTESMPMTRPEEVILQLGRARELGIGVSIDDFGTGYSNWVYLTQLPADTVKLDQSLISNLKDNESNKRLVKALIELATGIGYKVVAEGIEHQEIFDLLIQWGCNEAQGHLIAKPMSPEKLEDWLKSFKLANTTNTHSNYALRTPKTLLKN